MRDTKPPGIHGDWTIVALLGAGFVIAYIDRTNLSIALASAQFRQAFP